MEKLSDNNWVDIVTIPAYQTFDWTMFVLTGLALIFITSIIIYYNTRPRNRLLRKLNKLEHSCKTSGNKTALQSVEKLLCEFFNASQLHFVQTDSPTWHEFRHELIHNAYQPADPDMETTRALIQRSLQFTGMQVL